MSFQEWPSTLPQLALREGYAEGFPNTIFRTDMDTGPAKQRRRATAVPTPIMWPVHLKDSDEVEVLLGFYETNLIGGTLPFTHDHPRTGEEDVLLRFTAPPEITPEGVGYHAVLSLEMLP